MSDNQKDLSLERYRAAHTGGFMTTDQGVGISDTDDSLLAGSRGPTLMEDFIFREKLTHFDHERIPERVVHARGTGAHGFFRVYHDMSALTKARFLSDPSLKTPVFVRFSTVAGFRGSADTVRDVRGFAVKFYTQDGNYDIVGNNMPVFFIQDAIKFPDLIHAVKPEPNTEMPQAASAHDTFWDFVAHTPETLHNVIWMMSPRALPRSYRMMQGFGIHTFRMVNAGGAAKFVKFHWKPLLGVHSLTWDEAQQIAGKDPDFNRRDLVEAINNGTPAEYELGIQILDPADEFSLPFDILDATKLWPEELVPVTPIGKLTLDRNVDNFFAETEQVAFCPANVVPGIDFTNDPLLQGRLFSYLDTQLSRLGGPNFHELPINRALARVNNDQRDGMHRMAIDMGQTAYSPNGLNGGEPHPAMRGEPSFENYEEKVSGHVIRERSASFGDHFSQPAMFWNSMAPFEKEHIIGAFSFELGKCKNERTRRAVVGLLAKINGGLAAAVGGKLGFAPPDVMAAVPTPFASPALSMANTIKTARATKTAILLANGFDGSQFAAVTAAISKAGGGFDIVTENMGDVTAKDGGVTKSNKTFATAASVLYDAVFVPCGGDYGFLRENADVFRFVAEAYRHYKTVALCEAAADAMPPIIPAKTAEAGATMDGVILFGEKDDPNAVAAKFVTELAEVRHYGRGGIGGVL